MIASLLLKQLRTSRYNNIYYKVPILWSVSHGFSVSIVWSISFLGSSILWCNFSKSGHGIPHKVTNNSSLYNRPDSWLVVSCQYVSLASVVRIFLADLIFFSIILVFIKRIKKSPREGDGFGTYVSVIQKNPPCRTGI